MKNENQHIDELLVKSMLDEATMSEQMEINQWLSDNDDHQQYFEHFELIWNQSRRLAAQSTVDENEAWERFRQRVNLVEKEVKVLPMYPARSWQSMRVAAAVLLCFCTAWVAYLYLNRNIKPVAVTRHSENQTLADTLPDGSIVFLNKHSSISYPAAFKGNTREVTLTGEAFFDVKPDKTKPFLIRVNDIKVRVLGTSFNVKDNASKTEVVVETGIVEVARDSKKVSLRPKEEAIVWKANANFVKKNTSDDFHNYYRTKKLVCENTPLWRLVEILNETYGTEIVIGSAGLRDRPINTIFDQSSVNEIVDVISETLSLDVERSGKQIILK